MSTQIGLDARSAAGAEAASHCLIARSNRRAASAIASSTDAYCPLATAARMELSNGSGIHLSIETLSRTVIKAFRCHAAAFGGALPNQV